MSDLAQKPINPDGPESLAYKAQFLLNQSLRQCNLYGAPLVFSLPPAATHH
jgi:hypothetical protein